MAEHEDRLGFGRSRLALGMVSLLVLIMTTGREVSAQERSSYRRAVRAVESGSWETAAELLQAAIAEDPQERERLIGKPYLPHYYLGVARLELGNCRQALAAFGESLAQGVVQGSKMIADLESRQDLCTARGQAQAELERGREVAARVAQLRSQSRRPTVWQGDSPTLAEQERQALGKLQAAQQLLESPAAWQDPARAEEARASALTAAEELRSVIATASRRLADLRQTITAKRDRLLALMTQAKDQLVSRKVDRSSADYAGARQELLDLIGEVDASAEQSEAALDGLIERFQSGLERYRSLSAPDEPEPVPPELLQAAEHYFAAAYEEVLEALDGVSFDDSRADAQALLFRAAARYALYVLAGEQNLLLLDGARTDIGELKQIDPSVVPPPAAFSPRFVQFFDNPQGVQADGSSSLR